MWSAKIALGLGVIVALGVSGASAQQHASEVSMEENLESVPDKTRITNARSALARMKSLLTKVLGFLADARDEQDLVKLNCINSKLTAIKGLLKISEQADVTLQEGVARQDSEVTAHEYEKIIIAASKCDQLLSESEACIGELAVYSGETEVELEVEGVPAEDPTAYQVPPPIVTRPPEASPYQ